MGNKTLFNPVDTKATMFLFENSYQEVEGGSFKQRRRSLPIDPLVLEAFPEMFVSMITFIQHKLLARKSEVRLGLVFRPYNFEKRKKLLEKVKRRTMIQKSINDKFSATSFENSSSTTFIYGSDDEDDEMEPAYRRKRPMTVLKGGNAGAAKNLGSLNRHKHYEPEESLLSETNMQESEIFIHGTDKTQSVKIIDKSKRAFDISPDSTKGLELAI